MRSKADIKLELVKRSANDPKRTVNFRRTIGEEQYGNLDRGLPLWRHSVRSDAGRTGEFVLPLPDVPAVDGKCCRNVNYR